MTRLIFWIALISSQALVNRSFSQSSVFNVFDDRLNTADTYMTQGFYVEAIQLYEDLLLKNSGSGSIRLKLARCHYALKDYHKAIENYVGYQSSSEEMARQDLLNLGESYAAVNNYLMAEGCYAKCLERNPEDALAANKLWRIRNLQFLYEDSSHYSVRPVPFTTEYSEICPVPREGKLVFASNRSGTSLIRRVDANSHSFFRLYEVGYAEDSITGSYRMTKEPRVFAATLHSRYHTGPIVFYDKGGKAAYVATADNVGAKGQHTLGLQFARLTDKGWQHVGDFPFNSYSHSITDVAISEDGSQLYFSAEMPSGFGGKDIYTSTWSGSNWSRPTNLGPPVNTESDDCFPYVHRDGSLFFSSNGHAGLGGLDIYKSQLRSGTFTEPQNLGYPVNSGKDDFGIVFDTTSQHGYFSSNRRKGGFDDDIYEFDMDLQTYPYVVSGVVKVKEHSWNDSSEITVWPHVSIALVDGWQGARVYECKSDAQGNFTLTIPYFSKYYILVIDKNGREHKASLEIQKHLVEDHVHEIVIVTNFFEDGKRN